VIQHERCLFAWFGQGSERQVLQSAFRHYEESFADDLRSGRT
jgi:hypothetical protein